MDRIELFRVFLRVADSGSFTHAAEQLQLPRATVSMAVRQLEAALGGAPAAPHHAPGRPDARRRGSARRSARAGRRHGGSGAALPPGRGRDRRPAARRRAEPHRAADHRPGAAGLPRPPPRHRTRTRGRATVRSTSSRKASIARCAWAVRCPAAWWRGRSAPFPDQLRQPRLPRAPRHAAAAGRSAAAPRRRLRAARRRPRGGRGNGWRTGCRAACARTAG